ncbi:MAG: GNAT family N-acetyltransferase [Clostridia bacterium]|nr:GNAT family N-acetyltransferase [Clostridia bacterium]
MLTIKTAEINDYPVTERFYTDLIESMRDAEFKPDWVMGIYPTEQLLRQAIQEQTLYLAYQQGTLVGAMVMNDNCEPEYEKVNWLTDCTKNEVRYIHLLGVSPAYHGKGIAKQMVAYAMELCRKNKIKSIRLDVLCKNIPAARLYESMGFRHIETIKMYYEDTGLTDFLLYELIL